MSEPATTSSRDHAAVLGQVPRLVSAPPPALVDEPDPTPEDIARLLDVVATHNLGEALDDVERTLTRLRTSATAAAAARSTLRQTRPDVMRRALELRSGAALRAPRRAPASADLHDGSAER